MEPIEIIWKDPPAKTTRSTWANRLEPLKERPGQWAMVRQSTPPRIAGLRQRLAKTAALGETFEFRAHRVSAETAELYARYIASSGVGGAEAI